jgi:hypothetical protein
MFHPPGFEWRKNARCAHSFLQVSTAEKELFAHELREIIASGTATGAACRITLRPCRLIGIARDDPSTPRQAKAAAGLRFGSAPSQPSLFGE